MLGSRLRLSAWLASLCLSSLFGCEAGAPEEGSLGNGVAPIIGGTREPGQDNVVLLEVTFGRGAGNCTGALIADRVVLTAKHCVQEAGASGPVAANQIRVIVGPDRRGTRYNVAEVVAAPGTYSESGLSLVTELLGKDVALLTLYESPGVTPLPLKLTAPTDEVGKTATAIGYGLTPNSWGGVKMRVDTKVQRVDARSIEVRDTVCQGDSGGPLINENGQIIGVVSIGEGQGCSGGRGYYNRIDIHAQLILDTIERAGTCGDDGPEACDGYDNDCDGEVDEDCLADGESCTRDDQCTSRRCADTSRGKVCSSPCDPSDPGSCATGFVCIGSSTCEGFCLPGGPGAKALGEPCSADDECSTLSCADAGDGQRRCLQSCRGGAGQCLAGEVCDAADDQCAACVPASAASGPRGQDEACQNDSDCRSGRCLSDAGDQYCVERCTSDANCDKNHHCRDSVCVRGPRGGHGAPCSVHNDCVTDFFCFENSRGRYCTSVCTDDGDCGQGFTCRQVSNGWACLPEGKVLGAPCTSHDECLSGLCETRLEVCTRTCGSVGECGPGLECARVAGGDPGLCLPPGAMPPEPTPGEDDDLEGHPDAGASASTDDESTPSDEGSTASNANGHGGGCSLSAQGARPPSALLGAFFLVLSLGYARRRRLH